jgi:predicted nucleic acid-binding protein
MIIVDTSVAAELMRRSPAPPVRRWLSAQPADELRTTAITLAEIRYGLERLPDDQRKEQLVVAADTVFAAFSEYVLPFDAEAAASCALIVAHRERVGLPIKGFDAQIASICRSHDAALATRNVKDFAYTGVSLLNPWQYR